MQKSPLLSNYQMEIVLFPFAEVLSHPHSLLKRHLTDVRDLALLNLFAFQGNSLSEDEIYSLCDISCFLHDIGKSTYFFQSYIRNLQKTLSQKQRRLSSHALISAVITFLVLKTKFPNQTLLPIIGFIIVRVHHGHLPSWEDAFKFSAENKSTIKEQIEHINFATVASIIDNQFPEINAENCIQTIADIIEFSLDDFPDLLEDLEDYENSELYFLTNLLFSLLIYADKTDAITKGKNPPLALLILKSKHIPTYIQYLQQDRTLTELDQTRTTIFNEISQSCEQIHSKQTIFSINAPTGSGKTLSALHAALKIKERFNLDRIIYCLPFTSIIDQNFDVFQDVFRQNELQQDSSQLLLHHHLGEISYQNQSEDYDDNIALHFIETWESRLVVTTFVQLFETLISNRNRNLRKFHRLGNSVILLDEIQSFPYQYWLLCKTMLQELTHFMGAKIILMTATMPLIFDETKGEIIELLPNKRKYFEALSRIELDCRNLKQDIQWDDFLEEMLKLIEENESKNILIVLNTIKSTRLLYQYLVQNDFDNIHYLSSHVTPIERKERIFDLKEQLKNSEEQQIVISTQLIEAGVDIDLDIVVRDFAPLDNIFQTAGRCNRNSSKGEIGRVILYSIASFDKYKPQNIYDKVLLQRTKKVLEERSIIPESEFLDLAQAYFKLVQDYGKEQESKKIIEAIQALQWDKLKQFQVIPKEDYRSPIFVELDETAETFWREYQNIQQMEQGFKKLTALKKASRNLAPYIINISHKRLPEGHKSNVLYHLRSDRLTEFYDSSAIGFLDEKGLKLPPPQSSIIL